MVEKRILVRPIVTEKTSHLAEANKYVFQVFIDANKIEIKKAVEQLFDVEVEKVNTIIVKPRQKNFRTKKMLREGYTKKFKKAIVTVAKGKIELLK